MSSCLKYHHPPELHVDLSRERDTDLFGIGVEGGGGSVNFPTIVETEGDITIFSDNILHVKTSMDFLEPNYLKLSEK